MKSLWKISRRYIWSAIVITVLIININMFVFVGVMLKQAGIDSGHEGNIGRFLMEEINNSLRYEDGVWKLTDEGQQKLEESSFVWAMLLDEHGNVAWSYELPEELNRRYSIADVSAFSRWYLADYPVRTWREDDQLMVYGMGKEDEVRISVIYSFPLMQKLPEIIKCFLILNLLLLFVLALFFACRFYRSIRPIAQGIDSLAAKQPARVPQKGLTAELAVRLNQASEHLQEQDRRLAKRDMARTEWIAGVSHDIRTPLTLITGYADELAANALLGGEERRKAEQIQEAALVIGQLIADLNLTSKLEYQTQPLRMGPFFPAVLLRECVAEYYNQGIGDSYEIAVEIAAETEQIQCYGDTGLLLRVFRNLIGNSIRHNPDGCVVNVRLSIREDGVEYLFADSGPGIPERVVRVLREEEESAASCVENTAWSENGEKAEIYEQNPVHVMGLRVSKQIVMAHGWKLAFEKRESGTYDVRIMGCKMQETNDSLKR